MRSKAQVSEAKNEGVAQASEGQRPEAVRIADGDELGFRQEEEASRRPRLGRSAETNAVDRLAFVRVGDEVDDDLGVGLTTGRSTPPIRGAWRISPALTRLPLWATARWPCAYSMAIGWALRQIRRAGEWR